MRPFIRIGTRTTDRKKSAIRSARAGRMEKRHLDYMVLKYRMALFASLRDIFNREKIGPLDLGEFAEQCIADAFVRIKEYDERFKFRSFLVKKIVWPALSNALRADQKERKATLEYLKQRRIYQRLSRDYRTAVAKEFVNDAFKELQERFPLKYEVFYRREVEKLSYKEIFAELKTSVTLQVTSEAHARKLYERAKTELKHIFREFIRNNKYLDSDLPFADGLKKRLHEITTGKRR